MPSTSEKQRKFFGAVMGAKKGQKNVKGAAKKAAKDMSTSQIKDFLKKERFDFAVDYYLLEFALLNEKKKQRLDPKCWKGYHKEGTKMKGGVRVNNCVKNRK